MSAETAVEVVREELNIHSRDGAVKAMQFYILTTKLLWVQYTL